MKRRNFCKRITLGGIGFAGITAIDSTFAKSCVLPQQKSLHQWVILYWMPYDNDLSIFEEPIIEMLTQGTQSPDIAVTIQSDYWGDAQMRRRYIIEGIVTEVQVTGEDSSDISALAAYLDWADRNFEAKNWAVIVVGHGGKINQVSPDDHGSNIQSRTWMEIDQFTNVVSHFNQSINGKVELLFFQNCNKATLEVIYEARNCAKYTLASQLNLGAPNYYYEQFLGLLPSLDNGYEAGIAIMDAERTDMYHSLTLVDNQSVYLIAEKLSALFQTILDSSLLQISRSEISTYSYFGELHCDVLALLDYATEVSGKAKNELIEFADFLKSSIIISHQTGGQLLSNIPKRNVLMGKNGSDIEVLSGLSLYFPKTVEDIALYEYLELYQQVDLARLYGRITHD
jgi:hypothetical protein